MINKEYPGIFLRVKAAIIDAIILIILIYIATDIFSMFNNPPTFTKILAFLFIFILYEPLMVSFLGNTVGHKISRIKVRNLKDNKNINFPKAIIRFLVKAVLGWISFFTVSTNENKQAIHDAVVGSVVVFDEDYFN